MLNRLTVCAWVSHYFPSLSTFVFQTFYSSSRFNSISSRVTYLISSSVIRLIFYHLFVCGSIVYLTLFIRKYTFPGNSISVNRCTTHSCLLISVSFGPSLKFVTLPHSLNLSGNWPLRRSSLLNIQLTIIYVNGILTTHVSFIPLYFFNWILLCFVKSAYRIVSS